MSSSRAKPNIRPRNSKLMLFRFIEWLVALGVIALAAVVIFFVMMTPMIVQEKNVAELNNGDFVFADRFSKFFMPYNRGDVIVYRDERVDSKGLDFITVSTVGRVIAFGGEKVLITGGKVYIDGVLLDEREYAVDFSDEMYASFTVLENKLLILPDNRERIEIVTADGYTFEYDEIIGEVRFRAYPFGEIEFFV